MMRTETKIIRVLLEERDRGYTIRDVARKIGSDYRIVHIATARLLGKHVVEKRKVGRATEIKLSNRWSREVFEAEFERRERLLRDKGIAVLYEKLLRLPFSFVALVFGSYARGKAKKGSDIDLMIVCEKGREKELEGAIALLPLRIHPTILTYGEFLQMARSKAFNVVNEALKSNVLLVGLEEYYRLIENVG